MKLSKKGKDLIVEFEGLKLKPYLCSARVPTIGIGSTYYEDGSKIKMTDKAITKERAYELFDITVQKYEKAVNNGLKVDVTQNQYDALVSLCYNIGTGGFSKSTVLRKVNAGVEGIEIQKAFLMWNKAGGKVVNGLTRRRVKESTLFNQR